MKKRKAIAFAAIVSMVFLFGASSTLSAYEPDETDIGSIKLDYDRVENIAEGGEIYVYNIGGVEHKFPVPPSDFDPLTASDQQLETYGFPSKPQKNTDEYTDWVNIMSSYRSTPIPEIELTDEGNTDEDDNGISLQELEYVNSGDGAGYAAVLKNSSEYFAHVQGDFVQPKITDTLGSCADMFMVGFDIVENNISISSREGVAAGTRCIGTSKYAHAYYHCYGKDKKDISYANTGISFAAGDKVYVYVSYQRANNIFNYYIVNMTKGTQVSDIVQFDNANYYEGKKAVWFVGRCKTPVNTYYNLGKFTDVTFSNCRAMLNTSDTWTNLGDFKDIYSKFGTQR